MKEVLDKFLRSGGQIPDEAREALVTLIRAAQENADFREQIVNLLSLDEFNRRSALNTVLNELRLKEAPKDLGSALGLLLDQKVAQKVRELLTEDKPDDSG